MTCVASGRISDDLMDRLGAVAERLGLNRSQAVALAIEGYVAAQEQLENEDLEAVLTRVLTQVLRRELARVRVAPGAGAGPAGGHRLPEFRHPALSPTSGR